MLLIIQKRKLFFKIASDTHIVIEFQNSGNKEKIPKESRGGRNDPEWPWWIKKEHGQGSEWNSYLEYSIPSSTSHQVWRRIKGIFRPRRFRQIGATANNAWSTGSPQTGMWIKKRETTFRKWVQWGGSRDDSWNSRMSIEWVQREVYAGARGQRVPGGGTQWDWYFFIIIILIYFERSLTNLDNFVHNK